MRRRRYTNRALRGKLVALGCVVCNRPAQLHHSRQGRGWSQRSGDHRAYPLCFQHHKHEGGPDSIERMGREAWEARFGTEDDHIRRCHERVGFVMPEGEWI